MNKELINNQNSVVEFETVSSLFSSPKDEFGNIKFCLSAVSAEDFNSKCRFITYSINFQRYYLFKNVAGGNGHKWQRRLFENIINYQPMGVIEWVYTVDSKTGKLISKVESMDGQQRTKTFIDIMDNKVRLPKGATIFYNNTLHDVSNMNITDLNETHPLYVKEWLSNYKFVILNSNLTLKEKHKRFVDVNSQNSLSDQDIRSSLDNPLSHWLNNIMFAETPEYQFLKVDVDKAKFVHMPKLKVFGKLIQEIVSKVLVYGYSNNYTDISKNAIDSLYYSFNEEGYKTQKDIDKIKPIFDKMMQTSDYVIINSSSADFWKKRDIMIFMIVLWNLIKSKKKFDSKLLKGGYIKAINQLKKQNNFLNDWALENNYLVDKNNKHPDNKLVESIRERNNTFAACYTAGDSPITLEFVIESIKDKLYEDGIISVRDGKRAFSKEEKQRVCSLQNNQCACCGDRLNPDNTSSYEGDHIILHSEGGKTEIDNCEVLCLSCHQIKTKMPEQYRKLRSIRN
jgi:hypothetical protein